MQSLKHIFWDLDHTLWDFESNSMVALEEVYDKHNLASMGVPDFADFSARYHVHNDKYWERFRKGYINRNTLRWKRFYVTLLEYKIVDEKLANLLGENYLDVLPLQKNLMPYAIEILDYCKQKNYQQHIITNGFEETQKIKMQQSGIASYFNKIITSEKAMSLKPHAAIFNYAMEQTQATTNNSIMIGDALEVDVKGAVDIGMQGVWYNPAGLINNSDVLATHTIAHFQELLHII